MSNYTEILDNKSPIPLYYQLKSYIEDQITSGIWKPGTKISSELEISQQFQVSRTTVRQAIGDLVNEGKLERIQGRGTFVSEINIDKQIHRITGFTQDMISRGLSPSSEVLNFEVVHPPQHITKELHINESESCIFLKRLRKGNGKRIALETVYIPYNRFKKLLNMDLSNTSLYEIFAREFKAIPKISRQTIEALKCPIAEAKLLGIEIGSPIFFFHTTAFDQDDLPLEYTEGYYRGDRYILHLSILTKEPQ